MGQTDQIRSDQIRSDQIIPINFHDQEELSGQIAPSPLCPGNVITILILPLEVLVYTRTVLP